MAAVQGEKKAAQPQKKQKLASKKIHPKQKKLQLKQEKQKQKKAGARLAHKGKGPAASPKMARQLQQKKAPLATKGNGKAAPSDRNAGSHVLNQDKGVKLGRNICAFSCKDLLYEVNELMRKELTRRMFANKRRVSH